MIDKVGGKPAYREPEKKPVEKPESKPQPKEPADDAVKIQTTVRQAKIEKPKQEAEQPAEDRKPVEERREAGDRAADEDRNTIATV